MARRPLNVRVTPAANDRWHELARQNHCNLTVLIEELLPWLEEHGVPPEVAQRAQELQAQRYRRRRATDD